MTIYIYSGDVTNPSHLQSLQFCKGKHSWNEIIRTVVVSLNEVHILQINVVWFNDHWKETKKMMRIGFVPCSFISVVLVLFLPYQKPFASLQESKSCHCSFLLPFIVIIWIHAVSENCVLCNCVIRRKGRKKMAVTDFKLL